MDRRRIAELDIIIARNLARARELAATRWVCPMCDSSGCAHCDGDGFVTYDQAAATIAIMGLVGCVPIRQGADDHDPGEPDYEVSPWLTCRRLSRQLGLSMSSVQGAEVRGLPIHGWLVERRELTAEEAGRYHGHTQWLYRATKV